MSISTETQAACASARTAWEQTADGPKKRAARKHLHAAEAAMTAKNEAECLTALRMTRQALM